MTYLRINAGKAYYSNEKEEKSIDQISKDDILYLLDQATSEKVEFEMDEPREGTIQNEAHKIIYVALYTKFKELLNNKERFIDESSHLYEDALQKYQNE